MKNRIDSFIGNFFIILGIFCLLLWWYQKYMLGSSRQNTQVSQSWTLSTIEKIDENLLNPTETFSIWLVELNVENLEKETIFYHDVVGFDTISKSWNIVNLWENGKTFLRLFEEENYTRAPRTEAWLYHIAITHNNRKDLALRVKNILEKAPERYQWSADHSATEAFYFSDPEGNGLELYYDKPRKDWVWKDRKPTMGTTALDTASYIKKYSDVPVSEWTTKMGHVHLKVGNIAEAQKFYQDILLFEVMNNRGDALFVSRDKYHHHIGMNTWESLGAGKRTKNSYGLRSFELQYFNKYTYEQVRSNLRRNTIPVEYRDGSIEVSDPWGNIIIITLTNSL